MEESFWSSITSVAATIAAFAAAAAAVAAWKSAKATRQSAKATQQAAEETQKTMLHHVLEDIHKDYRSPEMHSAVITLRHFYKKHRETFVDKYEEIRKEDEKRMSSLDEEKRIEAERTLHYQRRLVSIFYRHLAALYVDKILPKSIIFREWAESDLRIIPEIIVPIENKLREVLHTPPLPALDENCPLLVLYRDSKDYRL